MHYKTLIAQKKYLNKRFTNNAGQSGFITKFVNSKEVYFKFDVTGWVGCFNIKQINSGEFKDRLAPSVYGIGFIGDGIYSSKENCGHRKVYSLWKTMIKRCYEPNRLKKFPTYVGCTVAKEWHNFQNFAEWYFENYPNDGKDYQLDKDHLVKGNKLYSPDTCCFLTPQQNTETSQAKTYTFISPNGNKVTVFNLRKFCRENSLDQSHMVHISKGIVKQHKGWSKA
jgi:hypothetical protein